MYKFIFKRIIDFFLAFFGILILSPIIIILTILLYIIYRGNPFFFQERPGKNEKVFRLYKYKSMNDKKDANGELLDDEERLTKAGIFIRKTSLDELPQLFNVLKGEMSLIGPRPLRVHYLSYYTKRESLRHTVRPGITGLAQVSGRNAIGWDEKLEIDAKYVEKLSFLNDFSILIRTVSKIFRSSDSEVILSNEIGTFDQHRAKQNLENEQKP